MSQWPQAPPPENMFGMGSIDMTNAPNQLSNMPTMGNSADLTNASQMQAADPMQDPDGMMSMLDSSMLNAFTNDMSMNLDVPDDEMYAQTLAGESVDGNGVSVSATERMMANVDANVPGGGPSPPGGPLQTNNNPQTAAATNNALTEFTKRRNWPAKVVEELRDSLQILDANGRIKYASRSITEVAGYAVDEIREMFLKDLIHPDDQGVFVSDLNESIASGNPLRIFFRLKKRDGNYAIFEAVGHAHIAAAKFAPNPNNQSPFCQAVFMMARPYPTKNASLLDSFLEHKIENERLKRRIADLRREEDADDGTYGQSHEGLSEANTSEFTGASSSTFFRSNASESSRPDGALNIALTRENLEGNTVGRQPDSLRDKMARYEGSSHTDTIEMLTGLRYTEGERSRGITTGNTSPALIKGDAGIAIPKERDGRNGDKKKKKLKLAEEYVCTDCGKLNLSSRLDILSLAGYTIHVLTMPRDAGLTGMAQGP